MIRLIIATPSTGQSRARIPTWKDYADILRAASSNLQTEVDAWRVSSWKRLFISTLLIRSSLEGWRR